MGWEKVVIDQSGKVDKRSMDTAVAVCPIEGTYDFKGLLVPRKVTIEAHKQIKPEFKKERRIGWFGPKMYAICIYYLLCGRIGRINQVFLGEEYTGHMDAVMDTVYNWLTECGDKEKRDFDRSCFRVQNRRHNKTADAVANEIRKGDRSYSMQLSLQDFKKWML